MKLNSTYIRQIAGIAAGVSIAFSPLAALAGSNAVFTTNQTAGNVSPANTQTLATSSVTANVAQVKATRTITVTNVPTVPVILTVGTCAITLSSVITSDTDCSNGNAAIATSTDTTQTLIANRIRTFTGLVDTVNGHGGLTIGSTGTTVSFTTTAVEASSTAVFATLSSGSDFALATVNTSGTVPVAQVFSATPANVEVGDVFRAIVNGTTATYTAAAATTSDVLAGLTSAINGSGAASSTTAFNTGSQVNITANASGTPFTLVASTTNATPSAQVVTFTPANESNGDSFSVTINGSTYTYVLGSGDTVKTLVENLVSQLAANAAVSCSENDVAISCTSATPGTPFTYSASAVPNVNGTTSSHHGGGGGGGGHVSTTTAIPTTTSGGTTTTTTTTTGTTVSTSAAVASWPVMTTGSTGASVMALQTWLIAKGYSIPAGATGYFGAQTTAALAAYQKASGIMPAVGYFGPITRAYIAAH